MIPLTVLSEGSKFSWGWSEIQIFIVESWSQTSEVLGKFSFFVVVASFRAFMLLSFGVKIFIMC